MQLLLYLGSIRNPVLYTYFVLLLLLRNKVDDVDGDHIELGVKHELELEVERELHLSPIRG